MLVSTCDYEYHGGSVDFKCLELVHGREMTRCMFHDINYLEGDNYEKNKEKVGKRFKRKLSNYRSTSNPFEFFGYCLPEISFQDTPILFLTKTRFMSSYLQTLGVGKMERAITSWKQYPDNTIMVLLS